MDKRLSDSKVGWMKRGTAEKASTRVIRCAVAKAGCFRDQSTHRMYGGVPPDHERATGSAESVSDWWWYV